MKKATSNRQSKIDEQVFQYVNPRGEKKIIVNRFIEVTRLSDGSSFGELALLKNEAQDNWAIVAIYYKNKLTNCMEENSDLF